MTRCPQDTSLIRWVAGELPPPAAADLESHVAGCESCRVRAQQMRTTWMLLGELEVGPPSRDLTNEIMKAAGRVSRPSWAAVGRLAAAIALAAGLGIGAGWLTPIPSSPPPAALSSDDLASMTGLDVLAADNFIMARLLEQEPANPAEPEEAP